MSVESFLQCSLFFLCLADFLVKKWEHISTSRSFTKRNNVTSCGSYSVSAVGNFVNLAAFTEQVVPHALTKHVALVTKPNKGLSFTVCVCAVVDAGARLPRVLLTVNQQTRV